MTNKQTYLERMEAEYCELEYKLDKLTEFMLGGLVYPNLDYEERVRMADQADAMGKYGSILSRRIEYAKEKT